MLQAKTVAPHLSPEKREALEAVVASVEAEAKTYAHFNDSDTLDALYELLPAWCLQDRIEQLIWNIVVCSIYGPTHARPFMVDSMQVLNFVESHEPSDVITSMAENAYTRYVGLRRSNHVEPEYESFAQLPEDLHRSSVERIVGIPEMLKTLGYRIVPAASCYPENKIESLAPSEVEVLAILEHRRWCEERKAAGWHYAETKNVTAKESPYLTEWEHLPERAREWNRCSARDIPVLLSAEGLAISS